MASAERAPWLTEEHAAVRLAATRRSTAVAAEEFRGTLRREGNV
jgi:hypothetical protein